MSSISLSCLIALARTSITMLSKSSKCGHPHLILDFRRKTFNISLLRMMLTLDLLYTAFIKLKFVSIYWVFFLWKDVTFLSNAFSSSIEVIRWFLFFILFNVMYHINWHTWRHPCIARCLFSSRCVTLLMCYRFQFSNILLRILSVCSCSSLRMFRTTTLNSLLGSSQISIYLEQLEVYCIS